MTADHAVGALTASHLCDRALVVRHVGDCGLGLPLEVGGDGPVAEAERPAQAVEMEIEIEDPVVEMGSHALEQGADARETVGLVSVEDEIALAVGADVDHLARDGHAAELQPREILEEFVMIARDIDHARLLTALSQQFLDQNIVIIVPMPLRLQLPAIDDIADKVEIVGIVVFQEFEEKIGAGMFCAEVEVGEPDCAIVHVIQFTASRSSLGGEWVTFGSQRRFHHQGAYGCRKQ